MKNRYVNIFFRNVVRGAGFTIGARSTEAFLDTPQHLRRWGLFSQQPDSKKDKNLEQKKPTSAPPVQGL